jgi:hypothetical protein
VTSHGRTTGYSVCAVAFDEKQRLKAHAQRSRATVDLTAEEIDRMASTRMDPDHDHLNALHDEE